MPSRLKLCARNSLTIQTQQVKMCIRDRLDSIKKQKVTLDIDIKGNDDAHNLAKSIEKGLKATKIDTSGLSKQLADAFNITDKSVVNKIKSQINSVMSELGKTWNGKEFNLQGGKGKAFISGLSDLCLLYTSRCV